MSARTIAIAENIRNKGIGSGEFKQSEISETAVKALAQL
jgi:hypothetical protein